MIVRRATVADLESMTLVLIGASPLDPVYPYRFPDRDFYPDEFAALCRQKCVEYLHTSDVVVCEMPMDSDPTRTRVVAFAAWDTPGAARRLACLQGEPIRHQNSPVLPITIGNKSRMNAFKSQVASQKSTLFDARYRKTGHVFLKILLTHPDYQRRGAGRALTEWGIDEARRLGGLDTTVFASPMGLELYRKLGFREIARFRVQLDGEDEFLEIPALVLPGSLDAESGYVVGRGKRVCGLEVEGGIGTYAQMTCV